MINYKNVLKNILLKEEENFFHGLSFIITSLIAVHIVIYFNFYKFSSNWIELESKKTTFIVTNNFDEKEIPLSIKESIVDYLFKNDRLENFKILEPNIIKESLGLSEVRNLSGLNLPLIFQVISDKERVIDEVYNNLLNISENRFVEKHEHEDQLYEIGIIVSRIKSIIFIMLLFVLILFSFLIMNIVKAALIANLNFVSMLQVMGASSLDLAKNISLSIFKKILPGTLLSLIFIFLISIILIRILGSNFNFFDSTYFSQLLVSNFLLLLVFMVIFTLTFLFFLTTYLFNFFENRFFEKF
jgi:cell division protein FtsX